MPTVQEAQDWYPTDDPVHGFDHVLRVYRMAERLAQEEGGDLEIIRAAALLHDAEGSATQGGETGRLNHQYASADFARHVLSLEDWPEERIAAVEHCIRAHRFRDQSETPQTLEAQILFDADKLEVIGAVGVVRTIAYAAVHGQPAYAKPSERFLRTGEKEPGEPHSAYHEFLFKLKKIKDLLFTPAARTIAAERHAYLVDFFDRLEDELDGLR